MHIGARQGLFRLSAASLWGMEDGFVQHRSSQRVRDAVSGLLASLAPSAAESKFLSLEVFTTSGANFAVIMCAGGLTSWRTSSRRNSARRSKTGPSRPPFPSPRSFRRDRDVTGVTG